MKRHNLTALVLCLALLLGFSIGFEIWTPDTTREEIHAGILYENDLSTPATWNFALIEDALREAYGEKVTIHSYSNVQAEDMEDLIRELARMQCEIIFSNLHASQLVEVAAEFPSVQFCQTSFEEIPADTPANYHTMNGRMDEGSYLCGVAAGMKLREMIDQGEITGEEALVGYICSFPTAEALSSASAFMLGALSEAPEARMRIRCTRTWDNYTAEKRQTLLLIQEGCRMIVQHTGTIGPALACEESWSEQPAWLIALHKDTQNIASTTWFSGYRVNYTPYAVAAVRALLTDRQIEEVVPGTLHGNRDMSAGFDQGWIEMLDTSDLLAAEGTRKKLLQLAESFRKGNLRIFQGDYIAVNPEDESDQFSLTVPFEEYNDSSWPGFHYLLQGLMEMEN